MRRCFFAGHRPRGGFRPPGPGRSAVAVLAVFCTFVVAGFAFPHNYLPEPEQGEVTTIPDISVSRAAYRSLDAPGQMDMYRFTAEKGQEIYLSMTVPWLEELRSFAPAVALIARDTSMDPSAVKSALRCSLLPLDEITPRLSSSLPPGRSLVFVPQGPREAFHEPFTGTRYWKLQEATVIAPEAGEYLLAVFSPGGETGKYVLAPGRREQFSLGDILALPAVRIKVRRFMEEPVWGDYLFWSVLGVAAAAGLTYGIIALAGR